MPQDRGRWEREQGDLAESPQKRGGGKETLMRPRISQVWPLLSCLGSDDTGNGQKSLLQSDDLSLSSLGHFPLVPYVIAALARGACPFPMKSSTRRGGGEKGITARLSSSPAGLLRSPPRFTPLLSFPSPPPHTHTSCKVTSAAPVWERSGQAVALQEIQAKVMLAQLPAVLVPL